MSDRFSALSRKPFRRYWLASFASIGATQLQIMGQGWLIFELTGSSLMLGYLGAAAAIPAIVMTFFGGAIADQMDKRLLLAATSAITAMLLLILFLLDFTSLVEAWHIILIAGLVSLISGVDWPARQAIFPLLIEREDMMSAVALNSLIWQSTRMVLPAAGGILIAVADTWLVFLFCSAGFLVMSIVILTLRVQSGPARSSGLVSTLRQVREGISYILTNNVFLVLFLLSYAIMFFVSSYMQLMPAFSSLLDVGETGYGMLMSISGVGSIAGTFIVSSWQHARDLGARLLLAGALSAASIYGLALAAAETVPFPVAVAAASVCLVAACSSCFMISSMTVLQLRVPEELRGRVMGLHGIAFSLMPLGGLLAGYLASRTTEPLAVSLLATLFIAVVLLVTLTQRDVRRIEGSALSPG